MYLKNKGNIMIFTIIFSAIITLILLFFCTMSVNIIKNSRVNIYTKDLYSIDDYEEEIIKLCSNKINECGLEEIKNSDEVYCISDNDFKCSYIKEKDYFNIIYSLLKVFFCKFSIFIKIFFHNYYPPLIYNISLQLTGKSSKK